MDITNVPLRPASPTGAPIAIPPPPARPVSLAQSEIVDPVEPVDPTVLPMPIKGLGIAPLHMVQVGDNDDIPVPPEPPRDRAVSAAMPMPEPVPEQMPEPVPEQQAAPEMPPAEPPALRAEPEIAQSLRQIEDGPSNPTVDIRS